MNKIVKRLGISILSLFFTNDHFITKMWGIKNRHTLTGFSNFIQCSKFQMGFYVKGRLFCMEKIMVHILCDIDGKPFSRVIIGSSLEVSMQIPKLLSTIQNWSAVTFNS